MNYESYDEIRDLIIEALEELRDEQINLSSSSAIETVSARIASQIFENYLFSPYSDERGDI